MYGTQFRMQQRYHFCTIFDYSYLAKALVLMESLRSVCDCEIYAFTDDQKCIDALTARSMAYVTIVDLKEIEDENLRMVKSQRDRGEYFWTIKASCILYLFKRNKMLVVTYVDADTEFFSDPSPLFNQMTIGYSVLLLPHNFSRRYAHEIKNGIYNAGYISFKNSEQGIAALRWWDAKCREWCFRKIEKHRFGDQLYLNEMASFDGVTAIDHNGALANWNIQDYTYSFENGKLIASMHGEGKFPIISYHFHYLRFILPDKVELGRKYIPEAILKYVYKPHIQKLLSFMPIDDQGTKPNAVSWKTPIIFILRKISNTYNVYSISNFVK